MPDHEIADDGARGARTAVVLHQLRQLFVGIALTAGVFALRTAFPVGHPRAAHDWPPGSTDCSEAARLAEWLAALVHPHERAFAAVAAAMALLVWVAVGAWISRIEWGVRTAATTDALAREA